MAGHCGIRCATWPDDQTVTDVAAFLENLGAEVRRELGNGGQG